MGFETLNNQEASVDTELDRLQALERQTKDIVDGFDLPPAADLNQGALNVQAIVEVANGIDETKVDKDQKAASIARMVARKTGLLGIADFVGETPSEPAE